MDSNDIVVPTHFDKDMWVTTAEVRPGNRAVMHHVIVYVRPSGSAYLKDAQPGIPFVPVKYERDENGAAIRRIPPPGAQPANPAAPTRWPEWNC